jgi:NAD(P)-dependent dehydrogenase (short-subunit alcohol dehydrogenase family)
MVVSSDPQVILCTGANRGFGFEIIHVLALRVPSSIFILACRQLSSGHEAVRELRKDGVTSNIEVVQLDVTKVDEIAAAGEFVKNKYGRLDGRPCPLLIEFFRLVLLY